MNLPPAFRLLAGTLLLGFLLMAVKFLAWWLTHSNAILSDALESIINVVAGAFALYSLWLSARPRDINHPYGHGKVEFLSAGFEGALISMAGLGILAKAGYNLIHPQELERLEWGIIFTAGTGAVNGLMGLFLRRRGKRERKVVLEASGEHLLSDAFTSAGLILGLGLVWLFELPWIDNAVAIVFGGMILFMGYRLIRRSVAGILDEADMQVLREVVALLEANRKPPWIDIHNLRLIRYGNNYHFDCHMTLPWYFTTRQTHAEITAVHELVDREHRGQVEFFIHVDPCTPRSCPLCLMPDCPVRQYPHRRRLTWTTDKVVENRTHVLAPEP